MNRFTFLYLKGLFFLLLACPPFTYGQATSEAQLRQRIARILTHWEAPGAEVSVVKDGRVVFLEGFGTTRVNDGIPVTGQTLTPVQSVSKSFTAVALSMLMDDGLLNWDDPVKQHIPEFEFGGPYLTDHITIRDLMSHRSGLPSVIGGLEPSDYTVADILKDLPAQQPAIEFREGTAYSQVGMALLGEIIARTTGKPWSDFVQQRIFTPLGMTHSYPSSSFMTTARGEPEQIADLMTTVRKEEGVIKDVPWMYFHEIYWPAGGIISTAEDMTRFMQFLLNGGRVGGRRLLSNEAIHAMYEPQAVHSFKATTPSPISPLGQMVALGLGWMVHEYAGRLIVEHGGALRASTTVALMPEEGLGVFVATNADFGFHGHRMVAAIKFAAFEHFLGLPPTDWIAVCDNHDTP